MRPSTRYPSTVIVLLLVLWCFGGVASAQQDCPAIEVNCSERKAGDLFPLKCTATVEGDSKKMNLTYQWSLSLQAPLKSGRANAYEMEADLSASPNQKIMVTVTVSGLPRECENSAQFESLPEEIETPTEEDDDYAAITYEPETPSIQLVNNISATGSCSEEVTEGVPAYFRVSLDAGVTGAKPSYDWTLTRGRIRSGQGTHSIIVDTMGLGGEIITATARVNGLGAPLRLSCTTMIKRIPKAYKLDEISRTVPDEEEAYRLRRFALRLNIGLEERALIISIGRRGSSVELLRTRAERIRDYLIEVFNVAPERIMETSVGFGRNEAIQLWVVQKGASPP